MVASFFAGSNRFNVKRAPKYFSNMQTSCVSRRLAWSRPFLWAVISTYLVHRTGSFTVCFYERRGPAPHNHALYISPDLWTVAPCCTKIQTRYSGAVVIVPCDLSRRKK